MSETSPSELQNGAEPAAREVLGDRFGFLLAKMHHRCARLSMEVLEGAGLGLTGMHIAALAMIEAAGPMPQTAVGAALGKDRTTMVSVIDELEREGLVERRRNPADRRAYALEVTELGREWTARAEAALSAAESDLLGSLGPDERELLRGMLQRAVFENPLDAGES